MGASVSVVVPTRDRRELLGRALRSVLAQTRPADEVLVVDDGSTDGTEAFVRAAFPAVRLVRLPGRGVAAARNRGVGLARGRWIAFLDSDDEWRPEKLERQLAALAAHPAHRACHTDEIWIRNGRRVHPKKKHRKAGGWIFFRSLPLCAISPSAVLLERALLDELGGFDETLPACEDYDLWLRLTAREPVLFVDEPLVVKHGGHADQLSRRYWGLDRFRVRALETILAAHGLRADEREAARRTLAAKAAVYLAGARKRGRDDEARRVEARIARYAIRSTMPAARDRAT